MKNIFTNGCVILLFMLFFTGCEVGITPLDYGDTDPSVGVIVTEVSDIIDGENGGTILEVGNVPPQITLADIVVELTGVGSENFETIVDLNNNIFTVIAKPIEGFTVSVDTTFDLNATVYINDVSSCVKPIIMTLKGTNRQPIAYDKNVSLYVNTSRIIILIGEDENNDPLTYSLESAPSNGTVVFDGDEATYTPVSDYNGTDSFTFLVNDGLLDSLPATVTITILPPIIPDTTVPVITRIGTDVNVEAGTIYIDAGATASDDIDGDITATIVIVNPVNTNIPDTYTVTYNVNDTAGNPAVQVIRTVIVEDTTIPVISLLGINPQIIEAGQPYVELNATATDSIDDDTILTGNIVINALDVNTNVPGTYTVTYDVNDTAGNAATQVERNITVQDTTIPIITLNGDAVVNVALNGSYVELNASASDTLDGNLTASIVIGGTVDVNTVGSYTITYDVNDSAGNMAVQVSRTVNVSDASAPVITLLGTTPVDVEYGSTYIDAGATAFDAVDGNLTASIVTVNDVNTSTLGTYLVTYDVNDSTPTEGIQVTRVVNVVDTTIPIIILNGSDTVYVEAGTTYTDAGATAIDNVDGNITANIVTVSTIDENVTGTYTVTYNVNDSSGNPADQVIRTVIVEDTIKPEIILNGASEITLELGTTYVELGATATDTLDGDISANIEIDSSAVNTFLNGTYSVRYNVSDAAGNAADEKVRTVMVTGASSNPNVFKWCSDATGEELWTSDGTLAGTHLLKDISPDTNSSPEQLTEVNGNYFFTADDGINGRELWITSGYAEGTVMVKDITGDASSSAPESLTQGGTTLFFTADDKINGVELWKSNGSEGGTQMVTDITGDTNSSFPKELIYVNDTLFFTADDLSSSELWKSDGTEGGTVMVPGITMEFGTTPPYSLSDVNGTLFFAANNGDTNGSELWKTDGESTTMITAVDINISNPQYITNVNGIAYFSMYDDIFRTELWRSNGDIGNLELVRDIETGDKPEDSSFPQDLTDVNGTLYFTRLKSDGKKELWRTDEKDGAKKVGHSDSKEVIQNLTNVNGRLYYSDLDKDRKYRLWWIKDNGDAEKIKIFDPVDGLSEFRNVNGVLYFRVIINDDRDELWTSERVLAGGIEIAKGCTP